MIPREFDFDGSHRFLDIAKVNDLLYKSRLHGWNHSISPGNNLPAFIPDRSLPVKHQVAADPIQTYGKKSSVVIPKGTIVAVDSIWHYSKYSANGSNDEHGVTPSGIVRLGTDVFGNAVNANVNDEAFGYGTTMNGGFVTIANGGAETKDLYRAVDVTEGIFKQDGTAAAASDEYTRAANIPAGIAVNNMFIDNKNKVYNFTTQILELNSIETDYYVTFPYVNSAAYNKFTHSVSGGDQTNGAAYAAVMYDFVYLYGNIDHFISGKYVKSDGNGKYIIQDADTTVDDAKTVQTVGKALLWDNKFPKEKMDEVITFGQVTGDPTYAGLGVTGSDLNGIPVTLVLFAWKVMEAQNNGTAPTLGEIQTAIKAGNFGYVKINLHVS